MFRQTVRRSRRGGYPTATHLSADGGIMYFVFGPRPAGTACELSRTTAGLRGAKAAARAVRRTAFSFLSMLCADGGGRARASASCCPPRGGGGELRDSKESPFPFTFYTLPFVRTKGNPKTAAVKRFRGRSCAFAESDACGTFEAIKRFPILCASSPRPPSVRNRFCRGIG